MESPDPILAPTASPPLTEHDAACFNAWFEHHRSLPEIATSLKICVDELAEWAVQPHIRQRLDAVIAVAKLRQDCLAVEASHGSLFRLSQLALYSKNEEVACRAATRILLSQPRPIRNPVVPAPLTPPPGGRGLGCGFDATASSTASQSAGGFDLTRESGPTGGLIEPSNLPTVTTPQSEFALPSAPPQSSLDSSIPANPEPPAAAPLFTESTPLPSFPLALQIPRRRRPDSIRSLHERAGKPTAPSG